MLACTFCLKPTYEEWKRLVCSLPLTLKFRLKPTYEEWKPASISMFVNFIFSLKPTYEEWKLALQVHFCSVEPTV